MVLIPFSKSSNRGKPPFFEKEQKPTKTQLKCSPDLCWNWLYSSQWVPATDFLKFCDRGGGGPSRASWEGLWRLGQVGAPPEAGFSSIYGAERRRICLDPQNGPPEPPPPPWDPPGGGWVGTPPGPNLWFQRCLWPTCAPLAVGGPPPPPPCADQLYRRPPASYWP